MLTLDELQRLVMNKDITEDDFAMDSAETAFLMRQIIDIMEEIRGVNTGLISLEKGPPDESFFQDIPMSEDNPQEVFAQLHPANRRQRTVNYLEHISFRGNPRAAQSREEMVKRTEELKDIMKI